MCDDDERIGVMVLLLALLLVEALEGCAVAVVSSGSQIEGVAQIGGAALADGGLRITDLA